MEKLGCSFEWGPHSLILKNDKLLIVVLFVFLTGKGKNIYTLDDIYGEEGLLFGTYVLGTVYHVPPFLLFAAKIVLKRQ